MVPPFQRVTLRITTIFGQERQSRCRLDFSSLVVILIIAGAALYLVNNYIPSSIKAILKIVAVVVCIWLLQVFGLWGGFNSLRIRR